MSFDGSKLKFLHLSDRLQACPSFFQDLVLKANSELNVEKIVFFGSRVRGDFRPYSDFDFAFWLSKGNKSGPADCEAANVKELQNWHLFREWVHNELQTLYPIDLVLWQEASSELQTSILAEGVILYEQN